MKFNQGMYISKDKCLACKLFTAPMFFAFGVFFTYKNYKIWPTYPKYGKIILVVVPLVLYSGGAVNTYSAYKIFREY